MRDIICNDALPERHCYYWWALWAFKGMAVAFQEGLEHRLLAATYTGVWALAWLQQNFLLPSAIFLLLLYACYYLFPYLFNMTPPHSSIWSKRGCL